MGHTTQTDSSATAILELRSDLDPELDDRFNNWCDHHHGELLSLPGVLRARRYRQPDGRRGTGRYLTVYDLESTAVLGTPAFLDHRRTGIPMPEALGPSLVFERTVATMVGRAGDTSGADALVRGLVHDRRSGPASLADWLLETGPGPATGVCLYQPGDRPDAPLVALLDCRSLGGPEAAGGADLLHETVAYRLVFDASSPRSPADHREPG